MHSKDSIHFALGVLGNVASCTFYLSSAPTICFILRRRDTGGLGGDLYVFMLFNCLLWLFYGLPMVHPNDIWVLITNACGAGLSILYIVPYLFYSSKRQKWIMLLELFVVSTTFTLVATLVLKVIQCQSRRIMVVGTLCSIISSIMHLSLLFQLKLIFNTRDLAFMHPWSSIGAFIKGFIWTTYGALDLDPYILVPNGLGILIGVFQLILFLVLTRLRNDTSIQVEEGQVKNEPKQSNSYKKLIHLSYFCPTPPRVTDSLEYDEGQ